MPPARQTGAMANRREFLKIGAAAALVPFGAQAASDADAQFYALLGQIADKPSSMQLAALRGCDPVPLSFAARLDYDGVVEGLELDTTLRAKFAFGIVGATISPYVLSQRSGAYLDLTTAAAVGIDDETARLNADAAAGVVPPDFIIDATLAKLAAARSAAPVAAALAAQIDALQALRPRAAHEAGVWRLPGGDGYYALALQAGASLAIAPPAAHDEGLRQVRELSARAEPLLRRQGLRDGTVGARLHVLGGDPRYLYSDDDAGRAAAAAAMNARLAAVRPCLAGLFTGLSPGAVTVEIAGPGKIGYRVAPSYDGRTPGAYYVDLREIGRRPDWSLPTVVHHETLPGHLLQLPLQEHAAPPPLRLRTTPNAFFEGWAIYAEQLAEEIGMLDGDERAQLGFLQSLLVRAARLVIDTGIHFKRWSREDAIARFFAIAGDAPDTLQNEVDRIVVQPGLTSGPALGRATILNLRERFGADRKTFHDTLLQRGAMRLSLLEQVFSPPRR